MLHWERRWLIIHVDFWCLRDLYMLIGALYVLGFIMLEWWQPGTLAPFNVWRPETWWMTLWKGQ